MSSTIHIAIALTLTIAGLSYFGHATCEAISEGDGDRLAGPLVGAVGLLVGMTIVWFGERARMRSRRASREKEEGAAPRSGDRSD